MGFAFAQNQNQVLARRFSPAGVRSPLIIQKEQRARLKRIEDGLSTLSREIHDLRVEYLKRRPLSKEDVAELVLTISEQPKFIEKQTELLLEQVKKLVEAVHEEVETVHHMVKRIS